jgi:tRNA(Ile)-lysidine synthase
VLLRSSAPLEDAFLRRLDRDSTAPIAVAFSGGPDSYLALRRTLASTARPVVAVHVDHGIHPQSVAWARAAETLARELGADFQLRRWAGEKPRTGLPAAARSARHRLLAEAAREAGAKVIVTGHTADDALENAALGQGQLREWSPSPVWPDGRGLMLLRPLLADRRNAIRARLAGEGLLPRLVDDPANADLRHPRIAARAAAARLPAAPPENQPSDQPLPFAFDALPGGAIRLRREVLSHRALALAITCAGGGERLPRKAEVARLFEAGKGALAGAKLIPDGEAFLFVRDAGEAARGGLGPVLLEPGQTAVFDGRFEIHAREAMEIRALRGFSARLPHLEQRALTTICAAARPALPLAVRQDGLSCPILAAAGLADVRDLVAARLAAACGAIAHESGL